MRTASYSVGFVRTEVQGEEVGSGTAGVMAPVLYIDCEKEMSFYTVDLTLPEALFLTMVSYSLRRPKSSHQSRNGARL